MKAKLLVLAGALALSVAACSGAGSEEPAETPSASAGTNEPSGEPSTGDTAGSDGGGASQEPTGDDGAGASSTLVKASVAALPSCTHIEGLLGAKLDGYVFDGETSTAAEENAGTALISCNWSTKEMAEESLELAKYASIGVAVQIDPEASSFEELAALNMAIEHDSVSDIGAYLLLPGTDKEVDLTKRLEVMGPQVIAGNVSISLAGMNHFKTIEDLVPLTVGEGIDLSKELVRYVRSNS